MCKLKKGQLYIIGAGGHGRVVGEVALDNGWRKLVHLDDAWPRVKKCGEQKVVGSVVDFLTRCCSSVEFIVAIGDNESRMELFNQFVKAGHNPVTLIHTSAYVSPSAVLGRGGVVMAGACINAACKLGDGFIVNTQSSVDHDCLLESGVHVCPGVAIAGNVQIGSKVMVGIGACVLPGVSIGSESIVGAGSTVIHSVEGNQIIVGSPAKAVSKKRGQYD